MNQRSVQNIAIRNFDNIISQKNYIKLDIFQIIELETGESEVTLPGENTEIDVAKTVEQAYDNLDNMIGKNGMNEMNDDTRKLLEQQKTLMNQLKQMTPLMNNAKNMLKTIQGIGTDINKSSSMKSILNTLNPQDTPKEEIVEGVEIEETSN